MKDQLVTYLVDAEWTQAVEQKRFWRGGPAKWIREAARKGLAPLLALLMLLGALAAPPASAEAPTGGGPDTVENGGGRRNNSGAGGN